MTNRLSATGFLSRVNGFFFGATLDEDKLAVETVRDLMAMEYTITSTPHAAAPVHREAAVAKKRGELDSISDENLMFLNKLLPSFSGEERARIINDVSSHGLTEYQTHRYLLLLESVTDLGNASGVFADPTLFQLVKGLNHAIKRTADSNLLGKSEQDTPWDDATDLSMEKLRVRFGLRLHIIAKTTYSEPLLWLFKPEVKELGLVLRDPSLETVLLRHPDRMEDIYDLLMINYMTTGNKIGSILDTEARLIKNRDTTLDTDQFDV